MEAGKTLKAAAFSDNEITISVARSFYRPGDLLFAISPLFATIPPILSSQEIGHATDITDEERT